MVPEQLRKALEPFGATYHPHPEGTVIRVPGALKETLVTPAKGIFSKTVEAPHDFITDPAQGGEADFSNRTVDALRQGNLDSTFMNGLLNGAVHGVKRHRGPQHSVDAWQSNDNGQPVHGVSFSYAEEPGKEGADAKHTRAFRYGSNVKAPTRFVQPLPEDLHHSVKAVVRGGMPIEALADQLAEMHGAEDYVKPEPQQFARKLKTALDQMED